MSKKRRDTERETPLTGRAPRAEQPKKRVPLSGIIAGAVIVTAMGAMLLLRSIEKPAQSQESALPSSSEEKSARPSRSGAALPEKRAGQADSGKNGKDGFVSLKEEAFPSDKAKYESVSDSEDPSPRSFLRLDFRNGQTPLDGFKLKNLEVTSAGITLPPAPPGSDEPRIGVLESPPTPFKHPSNVIVPIWRGENPAGTTLQVEVTFSPNNDEWTQWFPIEKSNDPIEPFYPDGSPNPNYGAFVGTPVGFGLELYPFVRYRVTLVSDNASASPNLSAMEFYHSDSTMGQGFLADDPPADREVMEAARSAFDQQQ